MKIIIAGSRTIRRYQDIVDAVREARWEISEVVSGKQVSFDEDTGEKFGADYFGEIWAAEHKIPVKTFPANWKKYGKPAGPIRNQQMVDYAEGLIAVWDGKSWGTLDVIRRAQEKSILLYIHKVSL